MARSSVRHLCLWLWSMLTQNYATAFALVAHLTWRWAFYLGVIVNGLALVLVLVFYWPPGFIGLHPDGKSRTQQFKELDFVGLALFAGGLTTFLVGVSFGSNPYSWRDTHVLAPLLIGGMVSDSHQLTPGCRADSYRSGCVLGLSLVGTLQLGQDCQTLSSSSSRRRSRICVSPRCCFRIRNDG